ncbi:hypothetical protein D9757_003559 [Collybiopsis confluens]|uniref:Uncharacterized protein n=1 Tax=Collybiopsis confluens TaxID=2823264 RepID=A0A8H5HVC8_9AGAR|nr:hypothetical protein D9757_003559 [Collybiopsis confluens]
MSKPKSTTKLTLTGSYRSDIRLLSSILHGKHVSGTTADGGRNDSSLTPLICISTLLTLGTSNSLTHAAHAISGRIHLHRLECLVCCEHKPTKPFQKPVSPPEPNKLGTLETVSDVANATRGKMLLEHWADNVENEYYQESYPLEDHLRDIFQILSYLSNVDAQNDIPSSLFLFLVQRRAFRKISACLEEVFNRYGSSSPFTQMLNAIRDSPLPQIQTPYQETVVFSFFELKFMHRCHFPSFNEDGMSINLLEGPYVLMVNSQNIECWLGAFSVLLNTMKLLYPEEDTPERRAPPPEGVVFAMVYCLQCLLKLKPVMKFITEVDGMERVIHSIESAREEEPSDFISNFRIPHYIKPRSSNNNNNKDREVNQDKDEDEDKDEDLNDGKDARSKDSWNAPTDNDKGGMSEMPDNVEGNAECEAKDVGEDVECDAEIEDEDDLFSNDERPRSAATRLLCTVYAVTAWLLSTSALSKEAKTNLAGKEFQVNIFRSSDVPPIKFDRTFTKKLKYCFPKLEMDQAVVGKLSKRCNKGIIHAEAALMDLVMCAHKHEFGYGHDVPIVASKKCCYLCWLLHLLLNDGQTFKLKLRGTHNRILSWIPPPGTPTPVLRQLRDALLQVIQDISSTQLCDKWGESEDEEGELSFMEDDDGVFARI